MPKRKKGKRVSKKCPDDYNCKATDLKVEKQIKRDEDVKPKEVFGKDLKIKKSKKKY